MSQLMLGLTNYAEGSFANWRAIFIYTEFFDRDEVAIGQIFQEGHFRIIMIPWKFIN